MSEPIFLLLGILILLAVVGLVLFFRASQKLKAAERRLEEVSKMLHGGKVTYLNKKQKTPFPKIEGQNE